MDSCDLCRKDFALPGGRLCPVCAEAILRLAGAASALAATHAANRERGKSRLETAQGALRAEMASAAPAASIPGSGFQPTISQVSVPERRWHIDWSKLKIVFEDEPSGAAVGNEATPCQNS